MGVWVAPGAAADPLGSAAARPRSAGSRMATGLLVLSLVLAALVGAAALAGFRGEVILTGSMEPALSPGDLIVVDSVAASQLRPGDIVSFRDDRGVPITHRVIEVRTRRNGDLAMTTRGDTNTASERWTTRPDATVGRHAATLPALGRVTNWTSTPVGRMLVFGALGLLLAGVALRRIWRS